MSANDSSVYSSTAGTLAKNRGLSDSNGQDLLKNSFLDKEERIKDSQSFLIKEAPITKVAAKQIGKEVLNFHASKGRYV